MWGRDPQGAPPIVTEWSFRPGGGSFSPAAPSPVREAQCPESSSGRDGDCARDLDRPGERKAALQRDPSARRFVRARRSRSSPAWPRGRSFTSQPRSTQRATRPSRGSNTRARTRRPRATRPGWPASTGRRRSSGTSWCLEPRARPEPRPLRKRVRRLVVGRPDLMGVRRRRERHGRLGPHAYDSVGEYTVEISATDGLGQKGTRTRTVTVSNNPATGPGPDGGDVGAPVVRRFRLTHKVFRVGRRKTRVNVSRERPPRGTKFKFRSSEAGRATLTIQQRKRGHWRTRRPKLKRPVTRQEQDQVHRPLWRPQAEARPLPREAARERR